MAHSWPSRRASSKGSATSPGTAAGWPSSQACSARPAATGQVRCRSPVLGRPAPTPPPAAPGRRGRRAVPQPAEHGEGHDAAGRHRQALGGQARHRRPRLGPASLLEVAAGQPGVRVAPVGVQVALGAPGDGVAQPPVGQGVAPDLPGARAEVGHGDGRQLVVPVLPGDLEAPPERQRRLVGVREPLGGADRVERPGELLGLAEALGELDGAPAGLDRARDVTGEHPHVGEPGIGGGQRRSRRCRPPARPPPRRRTRAPRRSGRRPRGTSSGAPAARPRAPGRPRGASRPAPARRPPAPRSTRSVCPHSIGVPLQQLGQPPVRQPAGEAQGRGVVVDRLTVGAERGGPLGGRGGVLQHGRRHARLLGVVGQPRRVVPGRHHQVGQDLAVQLDAAAGGDGPLHRQAGQLVAEAQAAALAAEHPGGDALVDGRRVGPGDRLQERQLDAVGHDRGGVERAAGHRREPAGAGEHGVAHGRRHLPAGGAEHLGDEERVAAGGLVEAVGVDPPRAGQGGHGLPGQRRELEAAHPPGGGQVADDHAQRVPGPELVVAVGHHHHRRRAGHPAADEHEQVQGGLVGPVGVLDHRHHRPATGVEQVQEARRTGGAGSARRRPGSASSPPASRAMSSSGPSGRGVRSASQAPQRTRASAPCRSQKARTSEVLPIPASPPTSTRQPCPSLASASQPSSDPRNVPRSSSTMAGS